MQVLQHATNDVLLQVHTFNKRLITDAPQLLNGAQNNLYHSVQVG